MDLLDFGLVRRQREEYRVSWLAVWLSLYVCCIQCVWYVFFWRMCMTDTPNKCRIRAEAVMCACTHCKRQVYSKCHALYSFALWNMKYWTWCSMPGSPGLYGCVDSVMMVLMLILLMPTLSCHRKFFVFSSCKVTLVAYTVSLHSQTTVQAQDASTVYMFSRTSHETDHATKKLLMEEFCNYVRDYKIFYKEWVD